MLTPSADSEATSTILNGTIVLPVYVPDGSAVVADAVNVTVPLPAEPGVKLAFVPVPADGTGVQSPLTVQAIVGVDSDKLVV